LEQKRTAGKMAIPNLRSCLFINTGLTKAIQNPRVKEVKPD